MEKKFHKKEATARSQRVLVDHGTKKEKETTRNPKMPGSSATICKKNGPINY